MSESVTRLPPYVSFKTFNTLLEDLRTHDIPNKFERTALTRFNGSNRVQLMSALRFLGLVSGDEATPALHALVNAKEPKAQVEELRRVLDDAYKPIMALNLQNTTTGELADAFRKHYKPQDSVLPKCLSFFIGMAKAAHVDLGKRVLQKARPGGGIGPRRVKRSPGPDARPPQGNDSKVAPAGALPSLPALPPWDADWPDEMKLLWMRNYDRLASRLNGED